DAVDLAVYTRSLHDVLPIYLQRRACRKHGLIEIGQRLIGAPLTDQRRFICLDREVELCIMLTARRTGDRVSNRRLDQVEGRCSRSEEHTSELQSREKVICRP